MNIFFKTAKETKYIKDPIWISIFKFNNYTLPTFTKKIFANLDKYLCKR